MQLANPTPAFEYTPEEYADEGVCLHWCLPSDSVTPTQRTFTATEYHSGQLHLVDIEYLEETQNSDIQLPNRDRYNSITAGRASRRIKQGPAEECPFCSEQVDFNITCTRLPRGTQFNGSKRWKAEVLQDFKQTVVDACRDEQEVSSGKSIDADINFCEIGTDHHNNPKLEIVTNTQSLQYAYPTFALPNWYSISYAIAQNPWVEVEEVTNLATDNTRICICAKHPDEDEYGEHYFRLLSQRETLPYETKQPEDQS